MEACVLPDLEVEGGEDEVQLFPALRQAHRVAPQAQLVVLARPLVHRRLVAVAAATFQPPADDVPYTAVQADKVGPVAQPLGFGVGAAPAAARVCIEVGAWVLWEPRASEVFGL